MQRDINKNKNYNESSVYKYTTSNIFIHYKRCIVTAEMMDPVSKTVKGVNVYVFNDEFILKKRYTAETGYFGKGGLKLTGGQEDDFALKSGRGFSQKYFKAVNVPIYLDLNFFRSYTLKPEFLSIINLSDMISVAKKSESGLSYILTSYYSKLSFPVINLILILIGISIGLLLGKKGNSPVSIGISLAFAFTWWVINSIALSLGESAQLNPVLSAFMSDIIFLNNIVNNFKAIMSTIDRYIFKQMVFPFIFGLLVFTFSVTINRILLLTQMVLNKGISISAVLKLASLTIPDFMIITLPVSFLRALLTVFGKMTQDNEIMALRASGISLFKLTKPVLLFALIPLSCSIPFSFYIAPRFNFFFRVLAVKEVKKAALSALKKNSLTSRFGNLKIFVKNVNTDKSTMKGIFYIKQSAQYA